MADPSSSSIPGPSEASASLFVQSAPVPSHFERVQGPNFEEPQDINSLLASFTNVGFQASGVAKAVEIIEKMRRWRGEEPKEDDHDASTEPTSQRCSIFLGFTSNLISSGLREVLLFLVKHKYVSCLVTTAGAIEEDLIKCLGHTYLADFHLDGGELRKRGMNRIGNLVVPNDNYCKFEDWVMPILEKMREEQGESVENVWTPSRVIERLGREINDESSVLYWAAKVGLSRSGRHAVTSADP